MDKAQGSVMEVGPAFLEQRALSLATVLLTRHPEVTVLSEARDVGYDLEVRITSEGVFRGRIFAIELKARRAINDIGTRTDPMHVRLKDPLRRTLTEGMKRLKDLPFPLLYMVFAMDTDRAFFGWLREPDATTAKLGTPSVGVAESWSDDTHRQIVERVNAWYEKRAMAGS
jgi:hypothetical protein